MTPTVKIVVATHKKFDAPGDPMYMPLQVGAEGSADIGYARDDTGDNISRLNPYFCEMTGLYWAWRNLGADYIGLVHYRRYFSMGPYAAGRSPVLSYGELAPYLGKVRLFVPNKRRYYIETLYSHYKHTHYISQLDETRGIISEMHGGFLKSFDRAVNRSWGYMFNMLIADRELLDDYCRWLFGILFELRARIGEKSERELTPYQGRLYGRVSEIIFNAWLDKRLGDGSLKADEVMEVPVMQTGRTRWLHKGAAFLMAKFTGRKYESSF